MERSVLAVALRRCTLTLATLLLLPAAAGAQLMPLEENPYGARIRVTPYVGWAFEATRTELWTVPGANGTVLAEVEGKPASGPVAGVNVEYAFSGPWSLLVGGMFMSRDVGGYILPDTVAALLGSRTAEPFTSSKAIFAKAGVSFQLREPASEMVFRRLGASLFAAPFFMLDMPDEVAGLEGSELFDNATHFGLNFGATAELPFDQDRLAFRVAFEDYFTVWSEDVLSRWTRFNYGDAAVAEADPSHQWVVRAGLSYRIR